MNSKNEVCQFASQIGLSLVKEKKTLEELKKSAKESIKIKIQYMIKQTVVGQKFIYLKFQHSQSWNNVFIKTQYYFCH